MKCTSKYKERRKFWKREVGFGGEGICGQQMQQHTGKNSWYGQWVLVVRKLEIRVHTQE